MSENKTNKTYSLNHHYDLYVKLKAMKQSIGSNSFRGKYDEFHPLFMKAFEQHKTMAMQLLFMLRDIKGGLGERELFRKTLLDLEQTDPKLIIKVLGLIPKYGRWDEIDDFSESKSPVPSHSYYCSWFKKSKNERFGVKMASKKT